MQPNVPQDVAFILPFVAEGIVRVCKADRLEPWKNALLAAFFLVATAVVCAWLSGTFLLGSSQASVLAVLTWVVILMNGSLKTVFIYLESLPSPFDGPALVSPNPAISPGTKAAVPTAIPLPAPPRANASDTPEK